MDLEGRRGRYLVVREELGEARGRVLRRLGRGLDGGGGAGAK